MTIGRLFYQANEYARNVLHKHYEPKGLYWCKNVKMTTFFSEKNGGWGCGSQNEPLKVSDFVFCRSFWNDFCDILKSVLKYDLIIWSLKVNSQTADVDDTLVFAIEMWHQKLLLLPNQFMLTLSWTTVKMITTPSQWVNNMCEPVILRLC